MPKKDWLKEWIKFRLEVLPAKCLIFWNWAIICQGRLDLIIFAYAITLWILVLLYTRRYIRENSNKFGKDPLDDQNMIMETYFFTYFGYLLLGIVEEPQGYWDIIWTHIELIDWNSETLNDDIIEEINFLKEDLIERYDLISEEENLNILIPGLLYEIYLGIYCLILLSYHLIRIYLKKYIKKK